MSRWWGLGLGMLLGCGTPSRIPTPHLGEHPTPADRWQEVETPPPPVEVEELPPAPIGHVWIDGQWRYQPMTRRWIWEQGRWCQEPPGTLFYAPPRLVRERTARIVDGEVHRVIRWNELRQRYEEVDVMVDRWRWIPGTFYVRGALGQPVPWVGELSCLSLENRH
ncbi:MAG: hypothetical protein RMJ98_07815 [Myxococcales bacterium]|nr:hypothetical protein [Polyangiaceae bacterium]MDW8249192.1 hypothetical protein [Myxococcales bacterium]